MKLLLLSIYSRLPPPPPPNPQPPNFKDNILRFMKREAVCCWNSRIEAFPRRQTL